MGDPQKRDAQREKPAREGRPRRQGQQCANVKTELRLDPGLLYKVFTKETEDTNPKKDVCAPLTGALFPMAETRKQPKCPSAGEEEGDGDTPWGVTRASKRMRSCRLQQKGWT